MVGTIGLSLTIPISVFADILLGKQTNIFGIQYFFGTILVFSSFLIVNIAYFLNEKIQYYDNMKCITNYLY